MFLEELEGKISFALSLISFILFLLENKSSKNDSKQQETFHPNHNTHSIIIENSKVLQS